MKKFKKPLLLVIGLLFSIFFIKELFIEDGEPDIYPDTEEAPILSLTWDGELDPTQATRYTPYGIWEGIFNYAEGAAYEPANEMQFYMITDAEDFRAVAPGIVTQNEVFEDGVGLFTVQYGENYAVTYMHILPDQSIEDGAKIETGDVIGKMQKMENPHHGVETWWEIQLTGRDGNKYKTLPPYEYFDAESKALLDDIAEKSIFGGEQDATTGSYWTITDKCSWIKHVGEPSWWASNRFSFTPILYSEKRFLDDLGLGWKAADEQGRIIGPNDAHECNTQPKDTWDY